MRTIVLVIISAFSLAACGKGDSASTGPASPIASSVSGTYKSADGNTTLNFSGGKVRVGQKIGKGGEYQYTVEGNAVKWSYEQTGVPESCKIKSSSTIYCSSATATFTKID
jgi:hypothetical protein